MTRELPLSQGFVALVDDADFEVVSKFRWFAQRTRGATYAKRCIGDREYGNRRDIFLHREIMQPSDDEVVDHISGNGLDNRRSNLRVCTRFQNQMNLHRKLPKSGFRGVYFHKVSGKYAAQLRANGEHHYLGLFATAKEAALAHDDAAKRLHGDFAILNNHLEGEPEMVAALSKAINAVIRQGDGT